MQGNFLNERAQIVTVLLLSCHTAERGIEKAHD